MSIAALMSAGEQPAQNLSIFDPVSPPGVAIRDLAFLVLVITAFIFVVVEGILVYSLVRFRRRVAAESMEPPQVYGSKPIEIAWTAAPALIVFVLVLVTTRTLWEVSPDPPQPRSGDNTLFVTAVGRQWWWEYTYDHYDGRPLGFTTANELHIPAGEGDVRRPVYLSLQSADVCHSFWVPRLGGKTDLIPGRTNSLWFETSQTGLFLGQCAEYCGTQHANMLLRVYVDPPAKFERWLKDQQEKAKAPPAGTQASEGMKVFVKQSCVNCHRVRGIDERGTYAPDLTHLMSRDTLACGMIENTEANLDRWIDDPQRIKQGCLMPAFGFSPHERSLIVTFLRTLR
jgi:cytochrome c oxidase subunit 2